MDGDGVEDLAVGASGDDTGGGTYSTRGAGVRAAAEHGRDGQVEHEARQWHQWRATLAIRDFFGLSVTALGDVDGDGVGDIAVGASGDDTGARSRSGVHPATEHGDRLAGPGDAPDTGTGTGRGNYQTLGSDKRPQPRCGQRPAARGTNRRRHLGTA